MDEEIFARFGELSWTRIGLIFDGVEGHLEIGVIDLDRIVDDEEEDRLISGETHLSDSVTEVDFPLGFHHLNIILFWTWNKFHYTNSYKTI